jgi:eukaryotic-like serine/threonine-protein kinase
MPITAADWKRLSPLLDVALDLAPADRAAWLATLPPEHADLRGPLAEMLSKRLVETDEFLNRLPAFSAAPVALNLGPGSVVGPYRLLRELGQGGTSSVWLAELADGSIKRTVALKLPHLGLVDRGIEQRIAREREILAGLEHPHIARLYDAGIDERGRPYLALEYVDGVPPDEYCRTGRLPLREKLGLFLNILRAVAFAHGRLIVHRDLKPNNILIAANADVRLLDFGIARLLQPDSVVRANDSAQHTAHHTAVGAAALTPAYAAPEQFTGQAVTVATDVYSLGVILFELLTGVSPYAPAGRSLGAYEHEVLYVEPPLMSRAARAGESRALRGDLDAIVAKALEKKPEDRYASVEAFATDLERHLAALPIAARPRSFAYVARKFVRRNLLSLGIAAVTVLLLSVSLGIAAWQWRDAERQRAIAVDRLANAEAAALFTSTVLIEGMQPGESLTFEQLIARSEEIALQTGRNDLRSRIFATEFLAGWYGANGLNRKAEEILTRTIESLPEESRRLGAGLRCMRAAVWGQLGRGREAIPVVEREIAQNENDASVQSRCQLMRAILAAYSGDANTTLEFAQAALRTYEAAGVESIYSRVEILKIIGAAHGLRDEFPAAHEKYREALRLFTEAGRERSRPAATIHDDWSTAWMNEGNARRALDEIDLGWSILRSLTPNAQVSDSRLVRHARLLTQLGRLDDASREFVEARALAKERGNVVTLAAIDIGEGDIAMLRGDLASATRLLDAAAARLRTLGAPAHHVLWTREDMARAALFAKQGRPREAGALLTKSIEEYQAQSCCRAHIAFALASRAELALEAGDTQGAAEAATAAIGHAPAIAKGSYSRFTGRAWYVSGLVHEAQGHLREAREAFATAASQYAGALGDTSADTRLAREAVSRVSQSR